MKKIVLTALILVPLALHAQMIFTLKGKVGLDNAPAKAFLIYSNAGKTITDSTTLKNGNFEFSGTITESTEAQLIIDHKGFDLSKINNITDMKMMYLDQGVINVISKDSVKNANFPGSAINAEYQRYVTFMAPSRKPLELIAYEYNNTPDDKLKDPAVIKGFQDRNEAALKVKKVALYDFIKGNPDSYMSLDALREAAGAVIDVEKNDPVFNSLSVRLRSSPKGKEFKSLIDARKGVLVGKQAPNFTQNDVNDKPVSLSDFKGKYVLLDFWASWCGPCRAENPNLLNAYHKYKDRNFTVLSVSLDRPGHKKDWLNAIQADHLEWTQVSDLKFFSNEAAKAYGITGLPQNFLLDKNGIIIAVNLRGEELDKVLMQLIR
ncbi:TlpA disulfide reductase family protein [Mucilaginibacter sp. KACC 22063]|uniref:TlpA disulfide reductase family protein n=1 Tax=Mucilaginibacter sp. KACC 22063 TaxID=3025666 RepID=UPI0023663EEF|nr:TlpA disulfide reductase family protein [Mucilaginibacter sp. KACC 22063]WDF55866.1 TlpA disulfide reductase family protein [Mucilaginibacter sp. KACC 22063]